MKTGVPLIDGLDEVQGRHDNDDDCDHNYWVVLRDLRHLDRRSPYFGAGARSKDGTMIELPETFLTLLFAILIISAQLKRSKIFG
jgi:hypothetical protein